MGIFDSIINILSEKKNENSQALIRSCQRKETTPEAVKKLIRSGADVNARDHQNNTSLISAANKNDNPEVIRTLIAAGADVNAKNSMGLTPLMFAFHGRNNLDIIQALIKAGADVNARDNDGNTALIITILKWNRKLKTIQALIRAGAEIESDILYFAFCANPNPEPEVIKTLIKAGVKPNKNARIAGKNLLEYAREDTSPEVFEMIRNCR